MSAVVRVKRRVDEEPLNAFVLNCKRRKVEDSPANLLASKDEVSTILKFAGTVESQEGNLASQIKKLTQDDAKELVSKVRRPQNVRDKNRQEMRQNTQDNRFKVVNCYRTTNDDEINSEAKEITIVDIEKHTSENENENDQTKQLDTKQNDTTNQDNNFVYDLYLPESDEHNAIVDNLVENLLSVRPFDDLVYGKQNEDNEEDDCESEDSNDENYFKNDYPDTEDSSINDDDMRHAVEDLGLGSGNELSSDQEEDDYLNRFVYSVDTDANGFEDDIDCSDLNRYGEAYARYKARILKKNKRRDSDEHESDLDDLDYYDDDSD